MSQSGKRDATAAFAGATESSPHSSKRQRQRKRKNLKTEEADVPARAMEGTPRKQETSNKNPESSVSRESPHNAKPTNSISPVSIQPAATSTAEQKEMELSERLEKQRAPLQEFKQERRGKAIAHPLKKSKQSTPSKSQDEQVNGQAAAKPKDIVTPKRIRTTSKKSLKNLTPKDKQRDDASNKSDRLLIQAKENRSEDAQIVSRRPREKKKPKLSEKPPTKPEATGSRWRTLPPSGGVFVDQDPLLTDDDQHLLLPTHSEVQVYSTKTSLLVRSLKIDSKPDLTSCALSTSDRTRLYIANSKGRLSVTDWTTGATIATMNIGKGVRQVLPMYSHEGTETVSLLQDEGHGARSIVSCRINVSGRGCSGTTTLLEKSNLSPCVRSFAQGSVLVACADEKLIIGQSQITPDGQLDLSYTWREITVPGRITSFDAQISSSKSKTSRKVPCLEVVVGLGDGVIMHYEDILFKLIGKEKKNQKNAEEIIARKLHWHRTAVNTVKWSRDRNYIISGGNETVLVIWQLDSSQRQYLPHLSTPILNLTVSAAGSSYALRLADNSVMILSTVDLLPSTNITGLALGSPQHTSSAIMFHPQIPHRLLAAIPSDAYHNKPSTFLQIYDIDSSLQLTRQALTRNMITATIVAPTGQSVKEPSVTHMKISHDGKWLATIDEWTPNKQDTEAMYISTDDKGLQGKATETSLRLWVWNESSNNYEQVTRIDEPHRSGPHSVLDISFNPAKLELATIGADATVRIWTPKARHRNGVTIRNAANEQLYTWTTSRTIHCDDASASKAATSATLAYAEDASVLAVSWSFPAPSESSTSRPRFTDLIDPSTGTIVLSTPSLLTPGPARLLFHTRYLLALSSSLTIFDTITCEQIPFPLMLDEAFIPAKSSAPMFLARNKFDGTFAVGVGKSEWPRASKIFVLSFESNSAVDGESDGVRVKVVHQDTFTGMLKGVLALTTGPGYLLIDERNQTRILRSTGTGSLALTHRATNVETEEVSRNLDSIFGRRQGLLASEGSIALEGTAARGLLAASERDGHAVDGGLNAVFNFTSSATAPSPADLFQRVVDVLARG